MSLSISHRQSLDTGCYGVGLDQLSVSDGRPIDLGRWFNMNVEGPLELEIGSGKGTFLIQQALATRGVYYIGIERASAFWRYAADRCRRHKLENVKIVHAEAEIFLHNYVAEECLRRVHIYFSDPWPKRRHHRRRVIQEPFLRMTYGKLQAGGQVRIATDHAEYFQWMQQQAQRVSDLFELRPFVRPESAGDGELVGTNFERKYRSEGRSFYGMVLCKRT